jgi:PiT family inorganic phosphate transporter
MLSADSKTNAFEGGSPQLVEPLLITAVVLLTGLAFANGSNDISKGIATLAGSGVTNYRTAILWGTAWTVVGGVLAVFISSAMVKTFSGILANAPGADEQSPMLAIAVMTGAMIWVLFASKTGLPVSTTHALVGGLCGVGLAAKGWDGIQWSPLLPKVVIPLGLSPVVAMGVAFILFPATRWLLKGWSGHCLCVVPVQQGHFVIDPTGSVAMRSNTTDVKTVLDSRECDEPQVLSIRVGPDTFHWITSGLTSFARSLNDTPKMAFLLLGFSFIGGTSVPNMTGLAFGLVAVSMGIGSVLGGRTVTEVLAEKVTRMDHQDGFTANLTTAVLVTAAANFGLPVSTTHVSASAIIGMGLRKGINEVRWKTVWEMFAAWILTLPIAGLLSAACWSLLSRL